MRHALFVVLLALLLAPLTALTTACSGGGAGGGDPEAARATLIQILDAARMDDFGKARGNLDVAQWMAALDHPQASQYHELPTDKKEELAKNCFNSVASVVKLVVLPDGTAVANAVRGGTVEHMPQLKSASVRFSAPDAERQGRRLTINAKLRYGLDRVWRLESIAADL